MASVFRWKGAWDIKWRDTAGNWQRKRTSCETKAEAKRLASDLERKAERQREGLDPMPGGAQGQTFGELMDWWWKEYGVRRKSPTIKSFLEKHLRTTVGPLPLTEVTASVLEGLLNERTAGQDGAGANGERGLAPETLNHLRALVHRMFALAIRRGLWVGANPAAGVQRRKVPRRLPQYLRHDEVPRALGSLDARWRPLVATAVYTGMRKGEILGLRKSDVDLEAGTIVVARSYDGETTKGGHAALLPIADELKPYLVTAMDASPSELVFPRPDGAMHRRDLAVDRVLRRALGRAGIVTGYVGRCRRKGCGYRSEPSPTPEFDRCPNCEMRLWTQAIPRHVRFHDLRHTTATLLLKAGVPLATVQKLLRHSDPALTSEIYGHLDLDDMRAGINRLAFSQAPAATAPVLPLRKAASAEVRPHGGPVVDESSRPKDEGRNLRSKSAKAAAPKWSGRQDLNLRPLAPQGAPATLDGLPSPVTGSQVLDKVGADGGTDPDAVAPFGTATIGRGGPVVNAITGLQALLTVAEVADHLRTSRATVYALCQRGELRCVRVLNSVRVAPADLEEFVRGRKQ